MRVPACDAREVNDKPHHMLKDEKLADDVVLLASQYSKLGADDPAGFWQQEPITLAHFQFKL